MGERVVQEGKARIVVGKKELEVLRALLENGGCVAGMLELINKAYGRRWHKRSYFRSLTRRIYRMEEKGLITIEDYRDDAKKGRYKKKICITPYGVKAYYSRV